MPTYVYACDSCGKQFEKYQSFKEDPLTICVCGQEGNVRRVIQAAGIVFKGSGWYLTDSRGGGTATVNGESGAKESKSDSASKDTKSDTAEKSTSTDTSAPASTAASPAPASTTSTEP